MWRHNQPQQHLSFCIPEEYSPGYCSIFNMIVIKDAKRPRSAPSWIKSYTHALAVGNKCFLDPFSASTPATF